MFPIFTYIPGIFCNFLYLKKRISMVQFFVIVATQFRCILVTVAKQIKLQKYLFSSLHFKETNNVNAFVIKENSFYSQREYILYYIKISVNVKIEKFKCNAPLCKIGTVQYCPPTLIKYVRTLLTYICN